GISCAAATGVRSRAAMANATKAARIAFDVVLIVDLALWKILSCKSISRYSAASSLTNLKRSLQNPYFGLQEAVRNTSGRDSGVSIQNMKEAERVRILVVEDEPK